MKNNNKKAINGEKSCAIIVIIIIGCLLAGITIGYFVALNNGVFDYEKTNNDIIKTDIEEIPSTVES